MTLYEAKNRLKPERRMRQEVRNKSCLSHKDRNTGETWTFHLIFLCRNNFNLLILSSHMKSKTQKQRWVCSTPPPVASAGLQPRFLAELNHNKKIILLVFQRSFRFILQAAVLMQIHKLDSQKTAKHRWFKKKLFGKERLPSTGRSWHCSVKTSLGWAVDHRLPHLLAWMHTLWAPCSFNYRCFYSD